MAMAAPKLTGPRAGFYSRESALRKLDGRSAEARCIAAIERGLVDQIGGQERISAGQRELVRRCSFLGFRLRAMEARFQAGTAPPEGADHYMAAVNTQARLLALLGLHVAEKAAPPLTLEGYLRVIGTDGDGEAA